MIMSVYRNVRANFLIIFILFFLPTAHPISFNITRFDPGSDNIIYEGDASFSKGDIELNRVDLSCRVGWAVYGEPVLLWDSASGKLTDFTTQFSFTIDTRNASVYGNGFAFFLAPEGYQIPPNSAGGFLGLLNTTTNAAMSRNQLVFIEFDSYVDDWDPQTQHVGINNNSMRSSVSSRWDVSLQSGKLAYVRITYNATARNLTVFWTYDENSAFVGNTSLSYRIDLTEVLPEWVKIGFSAATDQYTESNTIKSWVFTSNLEVSNRNPKLKSFGMMFASAGLCVFVLGLATGWFMLKRRTSNKPETYGRLNGRHACSSLDTDLEKEALPRRFPYQELVIATKGFSNDRRLGRGGSGHVYKGTLNDGRFIAVKRIFAESTHSESLFINEVKIISRLIHRNLVQFIGWCYEQNEFLLVYEYMPKGCLETHLFRKKRTLPWAVRYKIAKGLATAIHYLHEGAEQCVLHRDIKSANVLLDIDFTTKLGDFGVAKLVDPLSRTQTTKLVGTLGYLAPEYVSEGRASKESDMFSFGMVALEMACGRKPYQYRELQRWVWQQYLAGNILNAADERLDSFDENEMKRLLIVGLWCTNPNDGDRPKAGQVIKVLQIEVPVPELPRNMHDRRPTPLPLQQFDASASVES